MSEGEEEEEERGRDLTTGNKQHPQWRGEGVISACHGEGEQEIWEGYRGDKQYGAGQKRGMLG